MSNQQGNIYFLTGNENKFSEIAGSIPHLRMLSLADLPEIQSLDIRAVIRAKLEAAIQKTRGKKSLLVEDTGLYLGALNDFPGPLIKFLLAAMGNKGIYGLCRRARRTDAHATTAFGFFSSETGEMSMYAASVKGRITKPEGEFGFGWDAIFAPQGAGKTFAEMKTIAEKNRFSMRYKALKKVRAHLTRV